MKSIIFHDFDSEKIYGRSFVREQGTETIFLKQLTSNIIFIMFTTLTNPTSKKAATNVPSVHMVLGVFSFAASLLF